MRSTETRAVTEAFRFELDPNSEQRAKLAQSVGASRFVFNWGLAESQRVYEATGKRPRLGELKAQPVDLKKGECAWLYDVSAHIGQQALVDLDSAFDRFFKGLKGEGPRSGFPRFKKRSERDSARLYEVTLHERHIDLPKIGRVLFGLRPLARPRRERRHQPSPLRTPSPERRAWDRSPTGGSPGCEA